MRKRLDLWMYGYSASGDRYLFIPKVALGWTLIVVAGASPRAWARGVAVTLLVASLILHLPCFRFAAQPDLGWYALCPKIRSGEAVLMEINPGWKFHYRRGTPDSHGPL